MKKNYTLLSCIESKIIHSTKFYGRFELGRFATGQALTLANTLRRALLSQLPGVAITLVQIENVNHEYETICGVQESALDIMLNLKRIVLTTQFETFEPQIGYVHMKGPCVIRARDFKLPFFISCVEPDQYITTITEKGEFNMSVLINSGKNYLNHTPSSHGYYTRVAFLKQKQMMGYYGNRQQKKFYYNWKQTQAMNTEEKLFTTAEFVQAKLAQRLVKRQQKIRQTTQTTLKKKLTVESTKTQRTILQSLNDHQNKKLKISQIQPNQTALNKTKVNLLKKNAKRHLHIASLNEERIKLGYLPINAIFSPVTKVNYTIQAAKNDRKGETIIFEIWTNGSIDPRMAIHRSTKAIIKLFLPFQLTTQGMSQKKVNLQSLTNQRIKKKRKKAILKAYIKNALMNLNDPVNASLPFEEKKLNFQVDENTFRTLKKEAFINPTQTILPNSKMTLSSFWQKKEKEMNRQHYPKNRTGNLDLNNKETNVSTQSFIQQTSLYLLRSNLRNQRSTWPLFSLVDRLFYYYQINEDQYTKLLGLDISNLILPKKYLFFLNALGVYVFTDLFLIPYTRLLPYKSYLFDFFTALQKAISFYLYELTGKKTSIAFTSS